MAKGKEGVKGSAGQAETKVSTHASAKDRKPKRR
jgi:hypothetical protein